MSKLFALASDVERAGGLAGFLSALSGGGAAAEAVQAAASALPSGASAPAFAPFLAAALDMQDVVLAKASDEGAHGVGLSSALCLTRWAEWRHELSLPPPFSLVPSEADGYYILVTSFLGGSAGAGGALAAEVARRVSAAVAGGTSRAALRLRALAHVYNAVEERGARLALLRAIIAFAAATKQMDQMAPYLSVVSGASWQRDWGLSDAEARALFLQLAQVHGAAGEATVSQAFLIRYLATFEAAGAEALAEAKEHARDAALGYIRAPALSQRSSLAHLAAVSVWGEVRRAG